jgi:hypothetical protein
VSAFCSRKFTSPWLAFTVQRLVRTSRSFTNRGPLPARCVGVDETVLPDMLRVITSVEHTTGSADFTLTTRNLASECEPSGTAVTG